MISSIGGFMFGFSQLIFVYMIFHTLKYGKKADAKPWEGAIGLEWSVASPAPWHSFQSPPTLDIIHAESHDPHER